MSDFLISRQRSIIPALDCPPERGVVIVRGTQEVEAVSAFKLGSWAGTNLVGIRHYVDRLRPYLNGRKLIYDHQKAGCDIPDMAEFLGGLKEAGVDGLIIFPMAGPVTQEAWTRSSVAAGLHVFGGGEMTHQGFLVKDGGYIADDAPERMYRFFVQLGVGEFIVPGNKPDSVSAYRQIIQDELEKQGHGDETFMVAAPGFITQKGSISETGLVAGDWWSAIVGRAFVNAEDVAVAAREMASQIG